MTPSYRQCWIRPGLQEYLVGFWTDILQTPSITSAKEKKSKHSGRRLKIRQFHEMFTTLSLTCSFKQFQLLQNNLVVFTTISEDGLMIGTLTGLSDNLNGFDVKLKL